MNYHINRMVQERIVRIARDKLTKRRRSVGRPNKRRDGLTICTTQWANIEEETGLRKGKRGTRSIIPIYLLRDKNTLPNSLFRLILCKD